MDNPKSISITKVKIEKGISAVINYDEVNTTSENPGTNKMTCEGSSGIHEDFRNSMKALAIHLGLISEQVRGKIEKINPADQTILDHITVTGFSIGGSDDNEGVTVFGQRKLKSGKVLNLVAPFQKYEDENYDGASDLASDIHAACEEAKQYLDGKCAPKAQLEIFEEEKEEVEQE